jgi:hypothetical protein
LKERNTVAVVLKPDKFETKKITRVISGVMALA